MKISNIKLIGLLVIALGIYFAVDYMSSGQKSKSLKSELVKIDTAQVTKLEVVGVENSVELNKEGSEWKLLLENGKKVNAKASAVKQALTALNSIKPSRMATRKREKWNEYQVDTTGTRVIVSNNAETILDIVLGKLGVVGQQSFYTFVRLYEDEEVYVANNFMSFSVPAESASYREQVLAQINKDSISSIRFNYPSDSSFMLENNGNVWQVNGAYSDSTKTVTFLNGLGSINGREFMDEQEKLISPVLTVSCSMTDGKSVSIDAYQYNNGWVFNSSENPENYFTDAAILDKLFVGSSTFR